MLTVLRRSASVVCSVGKALCLPEMREASARIVFVAEVC